MKAEPGNGGGETMRVFSRVREQIQKHRERQREDWRLFFRRHLEFETKQRELQLEQRKLARQLRYLGWSRRGKPTEEMAELVKRAAEIQTQLDELRFRARLRHLEEGGDVDFDRYYRHMGLSRLVGPAFMLVIWAVVFHFIGLGSGLAVVSVFFALLATGGCVYEILFQSRISERILKPVENLKKGVREVARGNYDVQVENENINEVASLIKAFNEMAHKLRESERLKREYEENRKALVANISHDLKTPLTSIQGYVEALADPEMPAEKKGRYLAVLKSNAAYMNRLVDDLFVFSKLDLQRLELHLEQTRIRPFLRDMMEEFRIGLEERGVRFTYADGLTRDYFVKLDGKRVNQILRNLVSNAERYADKGRPLEIRATLGEADGFLRVGIADNGPGIPAESLPHLFERFYRVDSERTKHLDSTGLGLAIAKELAEAHGGTVGVESEPGRGARFTVSLPWETALPAEEGEQV